PTIFCLGGHFTFQPVTVVHHAIASTAGLLTTSRETVRNRESPAIVTMATPEAEADSLTVPEAATTIQEVMEEAQGVSEAAVVAMALKEVAAAMAVSTLQEAEEATSGLRAAVLREVEAAAGKHRNQVHPVEVADGTLRTRPHLAAEGVAEVGMPRNRIPPAEEGLAGDGENN
ncbi:MAG: hypothetical protein BJ554DRAFT_581, partial [Olpidium bornovanus]